VDAIKAPLRDLNLSKVKIPAVLAALTTPYDLDESATCDAINQEIKQLGVELGPDWAENSEQQLSSSKKLTEKISDTASNELVKALSSATSIIPFRSLIRRISGAKRHEKKLYKAYALGWQRRAFLKGLNYNKHCSQ